VLRYTITNLSPCTPTTSDISITSTCAALPVKIVSFEATPAINKQVQLTWKVSAEINVEAYEIEYSNDALNFTKIGTVPATSSNNYSYLHAFPNDGHNYYRLRVIEKDSKISYSEVRNVDFRSNNAVNIYPNPSSDVVKILVNTPLQNQQSSIQIYSMDGRIIYQRVTASLKQTESIDISKLAVGTYMLKLITKDNLVNKKFEIVR
nr:T9SS type A sorting domain-containing protein [Ferruginibacter sp.]